MSTSEVIPYRQIRAIYDEDTITVYQAYSESIAKAAVKEQKLYASPDFSFNRMTWIKPSWCWMMYRSGYATKDARQTHILALKMKHENFRKLVEQAAVCRGKVPFTGEEKRRPVRVQWDPERSPRLGALPYRSIQIGIGRDMAKKWAEEWIESIEDVTDMAVRLREVVKGEGVEFGVEEVRKKKEKGKLGVDELIERGIMPRERVYDVPKELRQILRMDEEEAS